MNANTAELQQRVEALEAQLADTPEAKQAQAEQREEQKYLDRLQACVERMRDTIPRMVPSFKQDIRIQTEQGQRHLDLLRRERRTGQHEQASKALGDLPNKLARECVESALPTPILFHDVHASHDEVQKVERRKAKLMEVRQTHVNDLVRELLKAANL